MSFNYDYVYTKEDYLNALSLQTADSRKHTWLIRLFCILAVGCAVYISVSTFRGTLFADDIVSYAVGLAVIAAQLLSYDSRFIPRLLFDYRLKNGVIQRGLIGRHILNVGKDVLTFSCGDMEHKIRYGNLIRVNYDDNTVLFYTGNGTAEAVPAHAFGSPSERDKALGVIEERAKASAQKNEPVIEPYGDEGLSSVEYKITPADFFHCNSVHIRYLRRRRLKNPAALFWAAVIIIIAFGSVQGLILRFRGLTPPMMIVTVYYVLGLIACVTGALLMLRPAWLVNRGFQYQMRMGQYPFGFFDARGLQWCGDWMAFQYGLMGAKFPWSAFSDILTDGKYIYLYQGDNLVIFIPVKAVEENGSFFPGAKPI